MTTHEPRVMRLGIVGLGRATVSLLPSVLAHTGVRIVAVADANPEVRDRFAKDFNVVAYATAEALCADPAVDAVYVSTPHQFHAPQTIMAAEQGKHVLVEKPMALSLDECTAMCEAAERNGVHVIVGHTHAFDRPVLQMRELIGSGSLGRLTMINTWNYGQFLYRPRRPEELDTSKGGGIIFNQVPHQVDVVRFLGGGRVRSVRSMAWVMDPTRPTEGSHATFLQFEDGAAATLVYSGYDYFDTDEFHGWIGEEGNPRSSGQSGAARRALRALDPAAERAQKARGGYLGIPADQPPTGGGQPHFGILVATCERGDIRLSPQGVVLYDEQGVHELPVPPATVFPDKSSVVDELYKAVVHDRPPLHDGRWGRATMEVCLAILQSAREQREVALSHQVPLRGTTQGGTYDRRGTSSGCR